MTTTTTNIDPKELEKFATLSRSWWDPNGESRALHDINPCRGAYIVGAGIQGKRALDVGCGGGILSELLAQNGAIVTGIDASMPLIEVAQQHAVSHHIELTYEVSTAEQYADRHAEQFDIVTCMELLEHVPNPEQLIEACARLIKPDGEIFFSTLNRTPKAYLFGVIGAEYIMRLVPKGTHDYQRFIRPSEISRWARAANLTVTEIRGMKYNPISRLAHISDDLSINYMARMSRR